MKNRFLGSNIAFVFGCITMASGGALLKESGPFNDLLLNGLIIVLGASAYKSIKARRIGLKPDHFSSKLYESVLLLPALLRVVLQPGYVLAINSDKSSNVSLLRELKRGLVEDPFSSFFIPLWIFTAYLIVFIKKPQIMESPKQ